MHIFKEGFSAQAYLKDNEIPFWNQSFFYRDVGYTTNCKIKILLITVSCLVTTHDRVTTSKELKKITDKNKLDASSLS